MKSEAMANSLKKSGTGLYLNSQFAAALIKYNKALCHAESDELKSLLYGNRSAIYFKVNRYRMCVENIQLAIQHGYPQEKMVNLKARVEKCKQLLSAGKDVLEDDQKIAEFFKLSYESHPKIPFIIDGIQLKTSEKYGNHLISNRDLKTGDIIAIEPLFACFGSLFSQYCYEKCAVCLRHNFYSLIPCDKCGDNLFIDMFCSESCKAHHNAIYHENFCPEVKLVSSEVGMFEKRMEAAKRIILTALNVFGNEEELFKHSKDPVKLTIFDVEDFSAKSLFKIFFSMAHAEIRVKGISQMYELESSKVLPTQKDFKELFIQVYATYSTNVMIIDRWIHDGTFGPNSGDSLKHRQIGESVAVFGSLFNHSCDPNIDRVTLDNKMVFVVNRPIKAGQQLFIDYGVTHKSKPADERKDMLVKGFGFVCDCDACLNDYPLMFGLRRLNKVFEAQRLDISTVDRAIETLKMNYELINKIQHEHPCLETVNLMGCNNMVMDHIAGDGL